MNEMISSSGSRVMPFNVFTFFFVELIIFDLGFSENYFVTLAAIL